MQFQNYSEVKEEKKTMLVVSLLTCSSELLFKELLFKEHMYMKIKDRKEKEELCMTFKKLNHNLHLEYI